MAAPLTLLAPAAGDDDKTKLQRAYLGLAANVALIQDKNGKNKVSDAAAGAFDLAIRVAEAAWTGTSTVRTIQELQDKIKSTSRVSDPKLKERVQYVVNEIILNSTEPNRVIRQINKDQIENILNFYTPDERKGFRWLKNIQGRLVPWIPEVLVSWIPGKLFPALRLEGHKSAGDSRYNAFKMDMEETKKSAEYAEIIKRYGSAMKAARSEAERIPLYFKRAQVCLAQGMDESEFRKYLVCQEGLLFEEKIARDTYSRLRRELLYMSQAATFSTQTIQSLLRSLTGFYRQFVDKAREGRKEFDETVKLLPKLSSIRDCLLKIPDSEWMVDIKVEVENLPQEFKKPDSLVSALDKYFDVVIKMESLDNSFEKSERIAEALSQLEELQEALPNYTEKYEELQIYLTIKELIEQVRNFERDVELKNQDVLTYAEQNPKVLVDVYTQLSQLGDLNRLPKELDTFKEQMVLLRNAFLIRATSAERMGQVLLQFFEKITSAAIDSKGVSPEKIAKEALAFLNIPYKTAEDCFLVAYKDYKFSQTMFKIVTSNCENRIKKLVDDAVAAEMEKKKTENDRADIWRKDVSLPETVQKGKTALEENLNNWKPFLAFCDEGIERVTQAILDNPKISTRGKLLFSNFYSSDDNAVLNHFSAAKFYYANSMKGDPIEQYSQAITEFELAHQKLIEQQNNRKEGARDASEQTKKISEEIRTLLQRAIFLKNSATYMAEARKLVEETTKSCPMVRSEPMSVSAWGILKNSIKKRELKTKTKKRPLNIPSVGAPPLFLAIP